MRLSSFGLGRGADVSRQAKAPSQLPSYPPKHNGTTRGVVGTNHTHDALSAQRGRTAEHSYRGTAAVATERAPIAGALLGLEDPMTISWRRKGAQRDLGFDPRLAPPSRASQDPPYVRLSPQILSSICKGRGRVQGAIGEVLADGKEKHVETDHRQSREPELRHGMRGCGEGVVEVSGLASCLRGRYSGSCPCASEPPIYPFPIVCAPRLPPV